MNDLTPYISIITPSYNQAGYIKSTIQSIHEQDVDVAFEHIVIDGGSTDSTLEYLSGFGDKIKWISEPDHGQSDALNKGIRLSKGEIIGWLNSDDLYLPGTLQKVTDYFRQNPNCLWVYGNCKIIDEKGKEFRKWIALYKNLLARNFHFPILLLENFICQPAVFFKKELYEKAGPIALDLPLAMDYDLWLRMAKISKPGIIRDDLACFRVHREAKSTIQSEKQFHEQYLIHKKYDQRKLYLFLHWLNFRKTIIIYWIISRFFPGK